VPDARYAVRAVALLHEAVYPPPVQVQDDDEKEGARPGAGANSLGLSLGLTSSAFYLQELCDQYMSTSEGEQLSTWGGGDCLCVCFSVSVRVCLSLLH
jgi:hypothetical protein